MSSPPQYNALLREEMEKVLTGKEYHHSKVSEWCSQISDATLSKLRSQSMPYKFIVTVAIVQRKADVSGYHSAVSCHWDSNSDSVSSYKLEAPTFACFGTLFAIEAE